MSTHADRYAAAASRAAYAKTHHAAFAEVLYITGIPRATTLRLNVWPSIALTFGVTDIFTQTPGPNAGERMKR